MSAFRNHKRRGITALLAGAGVICTLALAAVVAAVVVGVQRQRAGTDELVRLEDLAWQLHELRYYDADISGWQGYVLSEAVIDNPAQAIDPRSDNRAGVLASKDAVYALLRELDRDAMTPEERRLADGITPQWDEYFRLDATMIDQLRRGRIRDANDSVNGPLDESWSQILDTTIAVEDSVRARVAARKDKLDRDATRSLRLDIAVVVVGLLVIGGTGWVVQRRMRRPLNGCLDVLVRLADGDLTPRVADTGDDEFGRLGRPSTPPPRPSVPPSIRSASRRPPSTAPPTACRPSPRDSPAPRTRSTAAPTSP